MAENDPCLWNKELKNYEVLYPITFIIAPLVKSGGKIGFALSYAIL